MMITTTIRPIVLSCLLVVLPLSTAHSLEKYIIAANGGATELLEHSLPALTLAVSRGDDFIELHVAATADSVPIVFQDRILNRLTDVAERFTERSRDDGSYYVSDFTLDEIRQLRLRPVFATDATALALPITTLAEQLSLLSELEKITGQKTRIALEITYPWHYLASGIDISRATLKVLSRFGYGGGDGVLMVQCYDSGELRRLSEELLAEENMQLPLVQMVDSNNGNKTMVREGEDWTPYNYDWMFTYTGLRMIANYAWGVGLPAAMIVDDDGQRPFAGYLQEVKRFGLQLLVHSLQEDESIPAFAGDHQGLLNFYLQEKEIDGFYTTRFPAAKTSLEKLLVQEEKMKKLPEFFSTLNLKGDDDDNPRSASPTLDFSK